MMTDVLSYAELIDGVPPQGAEVHRVTRDNGTVWYCLTMVPDPSGRENDVDWVSPLPDGRRFMRGYFLVDRNDPTQRERIFPDRAVWGDDRTQIFLFSGNVITAFGPGPAGWECRLPDADPEDFILFVFIYKGMLQCHAQHAHQRDKFGERVFNEYKIAIEDGRVCSKLLETAE
jgi:hypothetical protein